MSKHWRLLAEAAGAAIYSALCYFEYRLYKSYSQSSSIGALILTSSLVSGVAALISAAWLFLELRGRPIPSGRFGLLIFPVLGSWAITNYFREKKTLDLLWGVACILATICFVVALLRPEGPMPDKRDSQGNHPDSNK